RSSSTPRSTGRTTTRADLGDWSAPCGWRRVPRRSLVGRLVRYFVRRWEADMAIDLVTRSEWGARAPKGAYSYLASTRGVTIHNRGGNVDPRTLTGHSRCVAAVRAIQAMHMDGNG